MGVQTISFTVPDLAENAILDAFVRARGWTPAHPLTRAQYRAKVIREEYILEAKLYRKSQDRATAEAAADAATSTWEAS